MNAVNTEILVGRSAEVRIFREFITMRTRPPTTLGWRISQVQAASKRHCGSIATAPVLILLALTLLGCGGSTSENSTPPPPPPAPSEFLYATAQNAIVGFTVDPVTGALSNPTNTPGPSYMYNGTVTPSYGIVGLPKQGVLYVSDPQNNQVVGFAVNNNTGALTILSGSPFALPSSGPLSRPWGMAVDPKGEFLYVSNSTPALNGPNGGTDVLAIDSTSRKLTVVPGSPFQDADVGFVTIDPSGEFLFSVSNLGSVADTVDPNTGIPTPVAGSPFQLPFGMSCALYPCNPVSLVEDSTGGYIFVVAYDGFQCFQTVLSFSIDAASGALNLVGSALQFGENCQPPPFAITTSGNFVYVSDNPGVDDPGGVHALSLAPATGALTEVSGSPFPPGTNYGGLVVTADGKFLYQASASTNTINVFAIDPTTGALSPVGSPVAAGTGPLILAVYKP
jgi:6-phosphogluconolactonase (cycloisomerase 2 family)